METATSGPPLAMIPKVDERSTSLQPAEFRMRKVLTSVQTLDQFTGALMLVFADSKYSVPERQFGRSFSPAKSARP